MFCVAKLATAFALVGSVWSAVAHTGHSTGSLSAPTKSFTFDVTYEDHAVDGFTRKMLLVYGQSRSLADSPLTSVSYFSNGQTPGPPIVVNEGQNVKVTFNNLSPLDWTVHMCV
jgi:FtsP/CotA-like multicopper oxidase with cupredoxin domain